MNKFFVHVYGCQMNVYDAQKIIDLLVQNNYQTVSDQDEADIIIFYTCNIREKAKSKLCSDIGRIANRDKKIIAIGGCIAQADGTSLFEQDNSIKIVFGPQTYHRLPQYIERAKRNEKVFDLEFTKLEKFNFLPMHKIANKTEYVTIQEGCDNFCTYCVVPYTRGREYSRPVVDVINEVKRLVDNGSEEIILVGQNVNSYFGEIQNGEYARIDQLLYDVSKIGGIKRLRYVTSNPKDFNDNLFQLHRDLQPIVPPFVHIPIQSGSNKVLKMMNRGHTAEGYIEMIEKFRDICPNIAFSSDFIVGFPGESEEDFQDTLKIVDIIKYSSFFAFKYSKRKNTPAYSMPNQVPESVKENRLERLISALSKHQLNFNEASVGTMQYVLFDKKGKYKNQYIGKTQYMQSVVVESENNLLNTFANVKIEHGFQNSLIGKLCD